jgi:hypothetical protein
MVCIGAFSLAATAGCTLKNVNVPPAELMRQVQAGQPMLDCRAECSGAWGQNRQQVRILDAAGRWQDLALLVAQIGYMNDLRYYYLGHAAENLGYWQARCSAITASPGASKASKREAPPLTVSGVFEPR